GPRLPGAPSRPLIAPGRQDACTREALQLQLDTRQITDSNLETTVGLATRGGPPFRRVVQHQDPVISPALCGSAEPHLFLPLLGTQRLNLTIARIIPPTGKFIRPTP